MNGFNTQQGIDMPMVCRNSSLLCLKLPQHSQPHENGYILIVDICPMVDMSHIEMARM